MKRLFIAMAALMASFAANAQEVATVATSVSNDEVANIGNKYKADEGSFGVTIGFGLNSNLLGDDRDATDKGLFAGEYDFNTTAPLTRTAAYVDFNYLISDNWEARLGVAFDYKKQYAKTVTVGTDGKDVEVEGAETWKVFAFRPGIVYNFSGTERLVPYIGADITLGGAVHRQKNVAGTETDKYRSSGFLFGMRALTGFNLYVCKNLYIGAEVGFGFEVVPTPHVTKDLQSTNTKTNNYDEKDKSRQAEIALNVNPNIRLGWKF